MSVMKPFVMAVTAAAGVALPVGTYLALAAISGGMVIAAETESLPAAQVIVIFSMTCLGMLLLIIAGKLVYDVHFAGNVFSMLGGFILSSLSFFGIGFILAGLMPTVRTAWVVAMVLLYPMLLLSGAFFSVGILPEIVQKISAFIPLTYVVNLLRGLWIGEAWSQHVTDVIVLAAILVAGVLVSVKLFRWE